MTYVWKGDPAKAIDAKPPRRSKVSPEERRAQMRAYYYRNAAEINAKRSERRASNRAERREEQVCGTNAGYMRHLRAHEEACFDCKNAHAVEAVKYRRKTVDTPL